jgi:hypothetical protein
MTAPEKQSPCLVALAVVAVHQLRPREDRRVRDDIYILGTLLSEVINTMQYFLRERQDTRASRVGPPLCTDLRKSMPHFMPIYVYRLGLRRSVWHLGVRLSTPSIHRLKLAGVHLGATRGLR